MSGAHIFLAEHQPATRFVDNHIEPPRVVEIAPRRQLWCHKCNKRRWASRLWVQVYYDATYFWCIDGHGCNARKRRKRAKAAAREGER